MAYPATSVGVVQQAQIVVNKDNIKIAQEPIGVINSINMSYDAKQAAYGQDVVVPAVQPAASGDFTPSNVVPSGNAISAVNRRVKLAYAKEQSLRLNGEDQKVLEDTNVKVELLQQWLGQAQRTMRNEMDVIAAAAIRANAGLASGTLGTLPFANDLKALTTARKELRKVGAPFSDCNVVTNLSAYENILNLGIINKYNEAGSDAERRSGLVMGQYSTKSIVEDAFIADHVAGAGANYVLDGNHAKGATTLVVKSGTVNTTGIKAGDIIKIEDDDTLYVVGSPAGTAPNTDPTFSALTAAAGNLYISAPGLRKAAATGKTVTIQKGTTLLEGVSGYSPNFVFERSAVIGLCRPPMLGNSPFYSVQSIITDSFGASYAFIEAIQDGQVSWFLRTMYGFNVIQPEFVHMIIS